MCDSQDSANAIIRLFDSSVDAQLEWWRIRTANIYARTLESFAIAANTFDDTDQILLDISAMAIRADKQAAMLADISLAQKQLFSDRLDNIIAEAITAIRSTMLVFDDFTSVEFQTAVADRLGLR